MSKRPRRLPWQGEEAPDWRVNDNDGGAFEMKEVVKKRKLSGCDEEEQHLLIRSDKAKTGYKGVTPNHGRYQAECTTSPCRYNYLGHFGTLEEAAQAYLQHREKQHPEQLKKERAPPLQAQEHLLIQSAMSSTGYKGLLIRSDRARSGYKGVTAYDGRYRANCDTAPCHGNYLGNFGTPEDAARRTCSTGTRSIRRSWRRSEHLRLRRCLKRRSNFSWSR